MNRKIESLEELIKILDKGMGYEAVSKIVSDIEIPKAEIEQYCIWKDERYTRTLLHQTGTYELLLICCEPGQSSLIHNYDAQEGWAKILQGELTLEQYYISAINGHIHPVSKEVLQKGATAYQNDYIGFHKMYNSGKDRSISLHVYSGPVENWYVWDDEKGKAIEIEPWFDQKFEL